MRFDDIALAVPRIMLPRPDIDLAKWSVIACDQHTSNPLYWEQVAEQVGDAPAIVEPRSSVARRIRARSTVERLDLEPMRKLKLRRQDQEPAKTT